MFTRKIKLQFKTLKKAFYELDRHRQGHITFDKFCTILTDWGFEAKDSQFRQLFNWLDYDKDQKISFQDLKNSIGLEILPQESFFFRQDVKLGKTITCIYEDCWENNSYNQTSQYCQLHQKIIKNYINDLLLKLSESIPTSDWNKMLHTLSNTQNITTVANFSKMIREYSGYVMTGKDKEFLYEVYKSKYDDRGMLIKDDNEKPQLVRKYLEPG